jgi:hypothetical protein
MNIWAWHSLKSRFFAILSQTHTWWKHLWFWSEDWQDLHRKDDLRWQWRCIWCVCVTWMDHVYFKSCSLLALFPVYSVQYEWSAHRPNCRFGEKRRSGLFFFSKTDTISLLSTNSDPEILGLFGLWPSEIRFRNHVRPLEHARETEFCVPNFKRFPWRQVSHDEVFSELRLQMLGALQFESPVSTVLNNSQLNLQTWSADCSPEKTDYSYS